MRCEIDCTYEKLEKKLSDREKMIVLKFVKRIKDVDINKLEKTGHYYVDVFFDIIRTGDKLKNIAYVSGVLDAIEFSYGENIEECVNYIENDVYKIQ